MSRDSTGLREHYAALADDELRDVATTAELTPEARDVLLQELALRGIHDLDAYKQQMDSEAAVRAQVEREILESRNRILRLEGGAGILAFVLLGMLGAVEFLSDKDGTLGVISMAVALIGAPLCWGIAKLRRAVARMAGRSSRPSPDTRE